MKALPDWALNLARGHIRAAFQTSLHYAFVHRTPDTEAGLTVGIRLLEEMPPEHRKHFDECVIGSTRRALILIDEVTGVSACFAVAPPDDPS